MEITITEMGVLSSYTRRKLLKILSNKRMALPDISSVTGMSKSTIHEHLAKLHRTGFVEREGQEGRKAVYYSATQKGARLIQNEARIIMMLDMAITAFIAGLFSVYQYFTPLTKLAAQTGTFAKDASIAEEGMLMAARAPEPVAEPAYHIMASTSMLWLFGGLLLLVIGAIIVYTLFRKTGKRRY